MSLSLTSRSVALSPGITMPFAGIGGTPPYTYSVLPGGAGGSIDMNGLYTAPANYGADEIQVIDSADNSFVQSVLIGSPLELFCDVIATAMGLDPTQVYIYNQKINIPTDSRLYVAVGILTSPNFGQTNRFDGNGNQEQSVNMAPTLSVNILSRGLDALNRKEELLMALKSNYAQSQQELNSFYISTVVKPFVNLSEIDGSAIPYRFNISVVLQYAISKTSAIPYYDTFDAASPSVATNP